MVAQCPLVDVAVLLARPFVFLCKLFGNRPAFLAYPAALGAFAPQSQPLGLRHRHHSVLL